MRIAFSLLLMMAACGPQLQNPRAATHLSALQEATTGFYENLIRTEGTADCRYSAPQNQQFWTKTRGDLRVIEANIRVFTPEAMDAFSPMRQAYADAEGLHRELDVISRSRPNLDSCLDSTASVQQMVLITRANERLATALQ